MSASGSLRPYCWVGSTISVPTTFYSGRIGREDPQKLIWDDPNRGPMDRAANATVGGDDPNREPVDRAANAINRNL